MDSTRSFVASSASVWGRLAVLRSWCLDVLRLSEDPADAETLADQRAVLRTLGMLMTDTGWRTAAPTRGFQCAPRVSAAHLPGVMP
jgi:hypothetical protein